MKLSRREFIGMGLGGVGGVLMCICGGAAGVAYLIATRQPEKTASLSVAVATSANNRLPVSKQIDKPLIIPREEWGALPPNHEAAYEKGLYSDETPEGWRTYEGDLRDDYQTLVVHHSVIDEGDDLLTLLEVQRLHREDRQWADVAYHFFIGKQGAVYEGRAMNVRGTHVAGYNTGSLGVCLLGDFMTNTPSTEQLDMLRQLSRWLVVRLQLTHLAGHRDFNPETLCPGDNLEPLLPDLAAYAGLSYGTDGYNGATPAPQETPVSGCICHI
jgi:hypothetical protein